MTAVVGSSCMARAPEEQRGYRKSINFGVHPLLPGIVRDGNKALPDQPSNRGDWPMSEQIKHDRRNCLATAATTVAAAQLGMSRSAVAQSTKAEPTGTPPIKPEI